MPDQKSSGGREFVDIFVTAKDKISHWWTERERRKKVPKLESSPALGIPVKDDNQYLISWKMRFQDEIYILKRDVSNRATIFSTLWKGVLSWLAPTDMQMRSYLVSHGMLVHAQDAEVMFRILYSAQHFARSLELQAHVTGFVGRAIMLFVERYDIGLISKAYDVKGQIDHYGIYKILCGHIAQHAEFLLKKLQEPFDNVLPCGVPIPLLIINAGVIRVVIDEFTKDGAGVFVRGISASDESRLQASGATASGMITPWSLHRFVEDWKIAQRDKKISP
jgi:hypothetical protein